VRDGWELLRWLALLTFFVAAVCDGVDGYIARRYHQRSELGALLDPLADKLLLVSAIVLLSLDNAPHLPRLPLWFTGTIIGRDVLLLVGLVVIHLTVGRSIIRPRWVGKVATVLQMSTVLWMFLKLDARVLPWLIVSAAACTGFSGILYVWDGIRQLSAHPSSAASASRK
jgi:CDP-diacylglycerol--glycerol-3-phosphate 3-phosphatidyltransferase